MSENYYTVADVQKRTNLKLDFIRRCTSQLKELFLPFIKNGEFNSLLFDSNALIIFDKIMQYKNDGFSLPAIKEKLQINYKSSTKQENLPYNTIQNTSELAVINSLLNEIKEGRNSFVSIQNQLTKANETITDKEKVIQVQKQHLNLLTAGRPPEDVLAEKIRKEEAFKVKEQLVIGLQDDLKQQKELYSKQEIELVLKEKALLEEQQKLIHLEEEKNSLYEKDRETSQKIQDTLRKKEEITNQLLELEGSWFSWLTRKKRKELFNQLQSLS